MEILYENVGKISIEIDFEANLLVNNKLPILDETKELIKEEIMNFMPDPELEAKYIAERLAKNYPDCKGKNIRVILRYGIDVSRELSKYFPYMESEAYCEQDPNKREMDIARGSVIGLRNKNLKTHLQYAIMLLNDKKMVESLNELLDKCREEK